MIRPVPFGVGFSLNPGSGIDVPTIGVNFWAIIGSTLAKKVGMFGATLKYEQRRALLVLLAHVAASDRDISETERNFIAETGHQFNTSTDGIFEEAEQRELSQICDIFDSEPGKRYALAKAIELGRIDGAYLEEEWVDIRRIARQLDISESDVPDLEDWVAEGRAWKKRGHQLISGEEH
jgi:uncharacterized tellurite resistance protein B-like protein